MKFNPLKIGNLSVPLPIIQGGMGIGISLSNLASAVTNTGGIGVISAAQIGFRDKNFEDNALECNLKALKEEIKLAKEKCKNGILGVNIMVATKEYAEHVNAHIWCWSSNYAPKANKGKHCKNCSYSWNS